uniref:Uncharacterized protein n=1 Tax=Globodera pallida TaxID=36090 RepID=A0A183BIL2_GLOPA
MQSEQQQHKDEEELLKFIQEANAQKEAMERKITLAKIVNQKLTEMGIYRMHPQLLIHEATINKVAQKQAAAKYFAAKKRQEREEKREREFVRRTVTPPDFAHMDADTVVPAEFDRAFRYGTLTAPVDVHSDSVYSLDDILIIGAQLELATLGAHLQQKSA